LIYGDYRDSLLENPDLFVLHYFSDRIDKLQDFHLELIRTATRETRSLILFPAAHGKTTLISTLLPIWAFCKDPNIRIAIIGKNDSEAEGIMRVIQAELVQNQKLIDDFGPFKPDPDDRDKPWALGAMSVAKRTIRAKEPTIAVFGSGAKTTLGHRTDWTICDDVVTNDNAATPTTREKLRAWFNLNVETGPERMDARLTVVGTLFHPEDLYHDIRELVNPETGEMIYAERCFAAIVDEEERITLWPERWPWKRLMMQKAKLGTLDFNKRYMNIAVDPSRMVFRDEYVKGGYIKDIKYPGCIDRNYVVGDLSDAWNVYTGFDPAVGRVSRSSKFCAHITLAVGSCKDHERCYWVVDLERDQMSLPQQVDLIIDKHQSYKAFKSVVEANSYQMGLWQAIKQKMDERGIALKIDPHYTNRSNKPDPETGVQAMAPWFENGKFHIPWGNPESQRKMKQLVDELIMYPGRTTDTVMALWMAWRQAQEQTPVYSSFNRLTKRMPWDAVQRPKRAWVNPYFVKEAQDGS